MIFLVASALMFFGALLPQSKYFTLIENNQTKVEVFAHYSQTRGYELPPTYEFAYPEVNCQAPVTFEWNGERNAVYQERLDQRFESLSKIRDRGPEFRKFLSAVDSYNSKLGNFFALEREIGADLAAMYNNMQGWCEQNVDEVVEGRNVARKRVRDWRERGVAVSDDWLNNLEEFGRVIGEVSIERGGENFAAVLEADAQLTERYRNLFVITLDYSRSVGEIEEANEVFLDALDGYELAETTFAEDYDQQQEELLFYSETFDNTLDGRPVTDDEVNPETGTDMDAEVEESID